LRHGIDAIVEFTRETHDLRNEPAAPNRIGGQKNLVTADLSEVAMQAICLGISWIDKSEFKSCFAMN
jgi:hypothetical protein